MQSAETVLDVLRERGRRGLPLDELYRQMFNPQLYLVAYGRLYSNKGALTPGPDAETADGMTLAKIGSIIDAVRHERYRFKPVKRTYIPKKNGKRRPLGLPSWSDKLVAEVVRLLLQAYYEPQFSERSHGFRPGRGWRALRIETVCNSPTDLGCKRRLHNLPELQAKARAANRRLLTIQRAGQGCAVSTTLFERVALPSLEEGQRTGALRFGDPRTMALVGALCIAINAVAGFTNRSLRAQVAGLLATTYTSSQMTYDLRRLRRKGLIRRQPRSNTYMLTADGARVAIFYTKVYGRLLRPLLAVDHPPHVSELRKALRIIDTHVVDSIDRARLPRAA
jgi:hypothetical protein